MRCAALLLGVWLLLRPPVGYGGGADGRDFVILHDTAIVNWHEIGVFKTAKECEHANDEHYHAAGALLEKGAKDLKKRLGQELFLRCVSGEQVRQGRR